MFAIVLSFSPCEFNASALSAIVKQISTGTSPNPSESKNNLLQDEPYSRIKRYVPKYFPSSLYVGVEKI